MPPPRRREDLARSFGVTSDRIYSYADRIEALKPPPHLEALHARLGTLHDRDRQIANDLTDALRKSDDPPRTMTRFIRANLAHSRELAGVLTKLGLKTCARLALPPGAVGSERPQRRERDFDPCPDIEETMGDMEKSRDGWARLARRGTQLIDTLERQTRIYPEERAKIAPDLRSSRRRMEEVQLKLQEAERRVQVLHEEARAEGC